MESKKKKKKNRVLFSSWILPWVQVIATLLSEIMENFVATPQCPPTPLP